MALTKITPQMFDTSAAGHDFNIDNGTFVVDASANRVGIGTTTPSTLLDVDGTATATTFVGALTGNVTGNVTGNLTGTILTAAQTNITSVGTLTGLNLSGNVLSGNKTGLTDTNTGHAIAPGGLVYHTTDGTITQSLNRLTDDGPVLRFVGNNTAAGSVGVLSGGLSFGAGTSLTTRMVIRSNGNVGIGASNPGAKLHIDPGTDFSQPSLIINSPSSYSEGDLYVLHGRDVNTGIGYSSTAFGVNVNGSLASDNIPHLRSVTGGLNSAGLIYVGADEVNQGVFGVMGVQGTAGTDLNHLFTVRSNGKVGIGTISPSTVLDVQAGGDNLFSTTGVVSGGVTAITMKQSRGSLASPSGSSTDGDGNYILSKIHRGGSYQTAAWVGMTTDSGADDGRIVFGTAKAGTVSEKVRINEDGKVGIGTTNPVAQFAAGGNGRRIEIQGTDGVIRGFDRTASWAQIDFEAASYVFDISGNEKMRIDTNGKVGIGATSPSEELHVSSTDSGNHTRVHITKTNTAGTAGVSFRSYAASNTWTLFQQDASASRFYFYDGSNYVMTLDSANNYVGIGEDAPEYPLHVEGANVSSGGGLANLCLVDTTVYNGTNPGAGITFRGKYNSGHAVTNFAAIQGVKQNSTDGNYDTALRFMTRSHNANLTEKLRIYPAGHQVQQMDGKKFFKLTDEFTAAANSTTNFKINVSDYTGASAGGYCHYTVSVMGYASGGANGLNFKYSVAGYSGHNYSYTNYNSYGAGTISNGASGGTQYTSAGLSYHPAVNLGGYIASGSVWVYVPAAQQYGVTVVNTAGAGMFCCLVVEGWST